MQITALIQVVNYLKELAGNPVFLEKYKDLATIIKEASANNGEDFTPKISKLKDDIKSYQLEADPLSWGYSSYSLFEKINSSRLFGKAAADYLENLVNHGNRDYRTMYSELNKTIKLLGKFNDDITRFSNLFSLILPVEELGHNSENTERASMFLFFEGKLSVQTISDLERYSRLWDGILDAFCQLSGEEKPSAEISNFINGRIVLGVSAGNKTMKALVSGVNEIITILPDLLRIRKIQYELVHLPLRYDLESVLGEEIEFLIDGKAHASAERIVNEFAGEQSDGDLIHKISLSLKQVLSFIGKGGKIEYNPVYADSVMMKNLTESFQKAVELESLINDLDQAKKIQQQRMIL